MWKGEREGVFSLELTKSGVKKKSSLKHVKSYYIGKNNLAEDLHIRPVLECRKPVQLCMVIVCPTKGEGKQRPKYLVRIPL